MKYSKRTNPFPDYRYIGGATEVPKKSGGIYAIVNRITRDIYIGSALNFDIRWTAHKSRLNKNNHHSIHLQNAWNKYGGENFTFNVLDIISDRTKLLSAEQGWMNETWPEYNIAPLAGRTDGIKHSEKSRENMRRNHADVSGEKNPMYGVKHIGQSNHMYGRKRPDTAEFNKRTKKGKTWEEMHGIEKADLIRKKAKRIGKENGNYGKGYPIVQLNLNGNLIKEFTSAYRASQELIYQISGINRACKKGNVFQNCYWKYKTDYNA